MISSKGILPGSYIIDRTPIKEKKAWTYFIIYLVHLFSILLTIPTILTMWICSVQEPIDADFEAAEIYNSNIGHNLSSLHIFLSEKLDLLSQVSVQIRRFYTSI